MQSYTGYSSGNPKQPDRELPRRMVLAAMIQCAMPQGCSRLAFLAARSIRCRSSVDFVHLLRGFGRIGCVFACFLRTRYRP